jgi:hypothetical protein
MKTLAVGDEPTLSALSFGLTERRYISNSSPAFAGIENFVLRRKRFKSGDPLVEPGGPSACEKRKPAGLRRCLALGSW